MAMDYNFTGSLTQRSINLGSVQEVSAAQLAQQARLERAARQEIRARHAAATQIQNFYRGRHSASVARQENRRIASELVNEVENDAGPSRLPRYVELTKFVAAATKRPLQERRRRKDTIGKSLLPTKAEIQALNDDDKILLPWVNIATAQTQGTTLLLEPLATSEQYRSSLRAVTKSLIRHLGEAGASQQATYSPFLNLLALLIAQNAKANEQSWSAYLVKAGLYEALRSHVCRHNFAASATVSIAIAISLAPLNLPQGKGRDGCTDRFVESILAIPDLPKRIPRTSLTDLAVKSPILQIADRIVNNHIAVSNEDYVNVLANFAALACKRVPFLANGAEVKTYLLALTTLQDALPHGTLKFSSKSKQLVAANLLADEESTTPVAATSKHVSASTAQRLQTLVSSDHINALLVASARFPNSTREPLCAFLTSSLQSWDPSGQDQILSCIAYGQSGAALAASGSQGRAQHHSIGGLVRELWRGWLRGSALARALSQRSIEGRKALTQVLSADSFKTSWPCLFVLCQLYSRSLLTIGDDEFYPDESRPNATAPSSSIRNPLSLDELVSLSSLLRNLAFAMYWLEGSGGMMNDLSSNYVIGSRKLDLLSLRNIVTRLLQQLQQRDSRRQFAPEGHWLMTTELDLNGFIQSVVMEEEELSRKQESQAHDGTDSMDVDEDVGDAEGDQNGIVRGAGGAQISARMASHRVSDMRDRALSARNLAYLSPRLGVLNNIPFVIPFEVRVEIFHQFTALDYVRLRKQKQFHGPLREVTIRRGSVAEDGFKQLNGLGENLKHRFAIRFVDQFGIEESGIDGGGLFKEFLTSLIKEAFDTDRGLWSATSDQQLYPNPHSYARQEENLQWYRFLGRILGKALYQGILVDINFASFFLSKWLGKGHGYLDDLSGLESLDKEVYRNLLWLKHYSGDVEKDLALDFTVIDEEFGEKRIHELVPNGRNIAVTRENRLEYIYRVSHYRLNEQIRLQSDAFMSGLTDLIDLRWLRMLNREEVRILISGSEGDIDLDDLRINTVLGGYHEKDQVLEYFWAALASFTHDQRKAFLKFATSCPSPPLLGFSQLNPKFGIRHAGDDTDRLPTASTCVNLLKLPRYNSYAQCREKLLYAIESGAGFDLS